MKIELTAQEALLASTGELPEFPFKVDRPIRYYLACMAQVRGAAMDGETTTSIFGGMGYEVKYAIEKLEKLGYRTEIITTKALRQKFTRLHISWGHK